MIIPAPKPVSIGIWWHTMVHLLPCLCTSLSPSSQEKKWENITVPPAEARAVLMVEASVATVSTRTSWLARSYVAKRMSSRRDRYIELWSIFFFFPSSLPSSSFNLEPNDCFFPSFASGFRETRAQHGCINSCVLWRRAFLFYGTGRLIPPFQTVNLQTFPLESNPALFLHSKRGLSFVDHSRKKT